jgi:hypothetical protein
LYLDGDVSQYGYRTIIFAGAMIFINILIPKAIFSRAFATLQDKLLDALESNAGLNDLRGWLTAT